MDMIKLILRDGEKPTKEQIKEIRAAAKLPIVYTPDCPESSPKALAEFAAMARELRKNRKRSKPSVTIRMNPDSLKKYKEMGGGYTGIMADVLDYAANNPDFLTQAMRC
jgi:uncharacterized protein (DUF4415 family)